MLDKYAYEPSMYHGTCARLKEFIQHFAHSGIALTRIGGCSAAWRPVVSRPPLSSITFNVYMSCLVRQWQAIDVERAVGHKYIVIFFMCVCYLQTHHAIDYSRYRRSGCSVVIFDLSTYTMLVVGRLRVPTLTVAIQQFK